MPRPPADSSTVHSFAAALLAWGRTVERPMPWRGERDPYRVWLSEVILQQTRVAQGEAYFHRFLAAFPDVGALAAATQDEVMALWQGLGYYSRARNLHAAARQVAAAGGRFPDTAAGLRALPGVGAYSSAAIASFAYDEPVAVVDGNVYRVLARYLGLDAQIDTGAGQRAFRAMADELLPTAHSAAYNQAIMDFGALVCTPRAPSCASCPLRGGCVALAEGRVGALPRKRGGGTRRTRHLEFLHLTDDEDVADPGAPGAGRLVLRKREARDIWQGLYAFPEVEPASFLPDAAAFTAALPPAWDLRHRARLVTRSEPVKHVLSHQDLLVRFWHYRLRPDAPPAPLPTDCVWVRTDELPAYGLPRVVDRYLSSGPTLTLGFD